MTAQFHGARRPFAIFLTLVAVVLSLPGVSPAQSDFGGFGAGGGFEDILDARAVFSRTSAAPGNTYDAALIVNIRDGWHVNSAKPHQDWLIPAVLEFDTTDALTPHDIIYPPGHDVAMLGEQMSLYDGKVVIRFSVTVADDTAPGEYTLPLTFNYQPCNDRECGPPDNVTARLNVLVGDEGTPVDTAIFTAPVERVEPPPSATEDQSATTADAGVAGQPSQLEQIITDYGFWGYFLALGLAFITGLVLSFSPCTYPMIPITVSIFAGQERSVARGFSLSLVYVGSMAVVYGIMGLIVSLVGGVFGAWLANPGVVIGIAIVFVIFSLSMFGLYELQVPMALRNKLGGAAGGGGIFGTIVLGIVAALVVSPCVGPFVAGILLYIATAGSPVLGFLILFVFAIGLGTLYILIGTFSTAINKLPNAGEWMEQVKKFFGFVLLLMALYFLRTIISADIIAILAGLLLLALGIFGGGLDRLTPESTLFPRIKKFVGVLAFLFGAYFLMGTVILNGVVLPPLSSWLPVVGGTAVQTETELIDWETDLDAALTRAKSENKPVLVDTWATWCVNCKVLDRETFGNPTVAAEAERFVPVKVQLETASSAETQNFMERFNMRHYSLPTVLLLNSDGTVHRVMQGVIGPEDMLAYMQQVE